jgi:hypothetical protein
VIAFHRVEENFTGADIQDNAVDSRKYRRVMDFASSKTLQGTVPRRPPSV